MFSGAGQVLLHAADSIILLYSSECQVVQLGLLAAESCIFWLFSKTAGCVFESLLELRV